MHSTTTIAITKLVVATTVRTTVTIEKQYDMQHTSSFYSENDRAKSNIAIRNERREI